MLGDLLSYLMPSLPKSFSWNYIKWNAKVLGPFFLHCEGWIGPWTVWAKERFFTIHQVVLEWLSSLSSHILLYWLSHSNSRVSFFFDLILCWEFAVDWWWPGLCCSSAEHLPSKTRSLWVPFFFTSLKCISIWIHLSYFRGLRNFVPSALDSLSLKTK